MIDATPPKTYTVASGDTLGEIAAAHKVKIAELLEWNTIADPDKIAVGDVINVSNPNGDFVYTVVAGDTVSELSEKFGKNWLDIAVYNKLEDVNLILIGQKLLIPGQGVAR